MKKLILTTILFLVLSSISHAAEVALKWDANEDPSLAGYKIHYGIMRVCGTSKDGSNFTDIIDVGNVLEHHITGMDKGLYSFAVTAYDSDGNESEYSYIIIVAVKIAQVKGFLKEYKNLRIVLSDEWQRNN